MNYGGKYSLRKRLLVEAEDEQPEGYFSTLNFPELSGKSDAEIERDIKIEAGETPVKTWEQLRELISAYTKQEEFLAKASAEGELAGKVGKAIIGAYLGQYKAIWDAFSAGMGAVKDAGELGITLNDMAKDRTPVDNLPVLDALQIDQEYADIIDTNLQDDMVVDFMRDIADKTGNIDANPDDWQNMNDYAEYWLRDRRDTGGSSETVTGADRGVKFTDLTIPDLKQSRLAGFGKMLVELF